MTRTRITGPPSRGRVKRLGLMGTGLLYLLLLLLRSTCLGQDAEGKRLFFFLLHCCLIESVLFLPLRLMIQRQIKCVQLGFNIRTVRTAFLTGSSAASRELPRQLSHNTSFLIHYLCGDIARWLTMNEETSTTQSRGRAFIWNAHYSLSPTDVFFKSSWMF